MQLAFWLTAMVTSLGFGQTTPPAVAANWVNDYRAGLRSELVEGDLTGAITAYRRVLVSHAPPVYVQRARYRLANALTQLGRDDEAKALLGALSCQLSRVDPLLSNVSAQMSRMTADLDHRWKYWVGQLQRAATAHDLGRLKEAAGFLAREEGSDAVQALLGVYDQLAPGDALRGILLGYLAESECLEVVPAIRTALLEKLPSLVATAAAAAGQIGDAESEQRLIDLLSSADVAVRERAIRALRMLRSLAAVDRLTELVTNDPEQSLRKAALAALHCIGSPRAREAVVQHAGQDQPEECECHFSPWYQQVRQDRPEHVLRLPASEGGQGARPAPRIGVLVSAMTHHGPSCGGLGQPYPRQVRKAWTLQRAGFDVCLLAEPEVMIDPQAAGFAAWFDPPLPVYPLDQWPSCDAVVMDQLYDLPKAIVRTIRSYCETGGRLVICGAVGGGFCGDEVAWREVVQVRRPHAHQFRHDAVKLQWKTGVDPAMLPVISPTDWLSRRAGSFYAHDVTGGQVLAEFDWPPVYALKTQPVGSGQVLCFNWGVGLNVEGSRDEDELLCRGIDRLVGSPEAWTSARYQMMRRIRWSELAMARDTVGADVLRVMAPAEQTDLLVQLFRVYLRENNSPAGKSVCRRLLGPAPDAELVGPALEAVTCAPRLVRIGVVPTGEPVWWLDLPDWLMTTEGDWRTGQRLASGVPLWLAGPEDLPAMIRLRLPVPAYNGRVRFVSTGAEIISLQEEENGQRRSLTGNEVEVAFKSAARDARWIDVELEMAEWNARVKVEVTRDLDWDGAAAKPQSTVQTR